MKEWRKLSNIAVKNTFLVESAIREKKSPGTFIEKQKQSLLLSYQEKNVIVVALDNSNWKQF